MSIIIDVARLADHLTNPLLLQWFELNTPNIHLSLLTHLQHKPNQHNDRLKAIEIYGKIQEDADLKYRLYQFLEKEFRDVCLVSGGKSLIAKVMVSSMVDPNSIFKYYNSAMLTIPMKMVFRCSDHSILSEAVQSFIAQQAVYDFIVFGEYAYIEYIPSDMANLAQKLPGDRWEIARYRQLKGIVKPESLL